MTFPFFQTDVKYPLEFFPKCVFVDKELATLWYMLIPTGKLIT